MARRENEVPWTHISPWSTWHISVVTSSGSLPWFPGIPSWDTRSASLCWHLSCLLCLFTLCFLSLFLSRLEVLRADIPSAEATTGAQSVLAGRSTRVRVCALGYVYVRTASFWKSPLKWLLCPESGPQGHVARGWLACNSHCTQFCWRPVLPEVTVMEAGPRPYVRCGGQTAAGLAVP